MSSDEGNPTCSTDEAINPSRGDGVEPDKVITKNIIAPPSESEQNDRGTFQCRSRRERPRKLRPLFGSGDGNNVGNDSRLDAFEPDIASLVSSCIPGVSFPPVVPEDVRNVSMERPKIVRKRSLPLMSFLSTKTLADAEKKRKREEQDRLKLLAEEAAKKIIESTLTLPGNDWSPVEEPNNVSGDFQFNRSEGQTNASAANEEGTYGKTLPCDFNSQVLSTSVPKESTTTVTIEGMSNVLMPPMLVDFLNTLNTLKH